MKIAIEVRGGTIVNVIADFPLGECIIIDHDNRLLDENNPDRIDPDSILERDVYVARTEDMEAEVASLVAEACK